MKINQNWLPLLALVAVLVVPAKGHSSITINYEVAEISSGGSLVFSGTLLFISHGSDNALDSLGWTSGTTFIRGDDRFFWAAQITNGVAAGAIPSVNMPSGTISNTTKFSGIFIAGLTSADVDYSNGSLLGGKTFAASGGDIYNFGSYRTDSIEDFGGDPTGNMAWVFPSDGALLQLSAYSNTGDTYVGGAITANLATSSTFNVVPEPSTASLMMLGAAGLVALRRLRKV
jgi:hypothetical protein